MEQNQYISLFIKYIECQKNKIEIDKWCKGTEIKNDPGDGFIISWINDNAKWFRDAWEISDCKECSKWQKCGWKVEKGCNNYFIET